MRRRVLVVSASMGAGHDGASRELVTRLRARGHEARMVDFLDAPVLRIGPLVRVLYELQLRLAPWAYEATYRIWCLLPALCGPLVAFVSLVTRRRILAWIRDFEADVVVTTYPLASLTLGRQRQLGRIEVPVVTFVTDFAVHPLWVHPAVDLNLCVHPASAVTARARTGRPSLAPGPMVDARFRGDLPDRDEARRRLGLGPDERAVLVVAGSWGVGDIEATFDALVSAGEYTPIVACGNNERLRRRLEAKGRGMALGWTDQMPALMTASDALVQNAGGLTCMEAFAVGLPVVTFRPIPGHGRENGLQMERAGVAAFAQGDDDLVATLHRVTGPAGAAMVEAGRAMFVGDPADDVLALADAPAPAAVRSVRRSVTYRRRVAAAAASLAAVYASLTVGVGEAAAHGLGAAHGERHATAVFLGVRLGARTVGDPAVASRLAGMGATAVVNGDLAVQDPQAVRRLADAGVDVANGGWGRHTRTRWSRARVDLVRSCRALRAAGEPHCREFVPERPVDGFDLASARLSHERVVVPSGRLSLGHLPARLRPGRVYVVDADASDTGSLERGLDRLGALLGSERLKAAPLLALR